MAAHLACFVAATAFVCQSTAEQRVTLQSGAVIEGDVRFDGDRILVTVGGAELPAPLAEVVSVRAAEGGELAEHQRLVLRGLEAELLQGRGAGLGLLKEAHRLAPDDPGAAFWCAWSLVKAGQGAAAHSIVDPHRERVLEAYPGEARRLFDAIEKRQELESLPALLLRRLDELNRQIDGTSSLLAENQLHAAYFQLVDQNGTPVGETPFRIRSRGSNASLEAYPEGYYLHTEQRRNRVSGGGPSQLELTSTAYRASELAFSTSPNAVIDAGVLKVFRHSVADKREVLVRVVGPDGAPLAGASVVARSTGVKRDARSAEPKRTDTGGECTLSLYPGPHQVTASLRGHTQSGHELGVSSETKPRAIVLTLHPLIAARATVEWISTKNSDPNGFSLEGMQKGSILAYTGGSDARSRVACGISFEQKDDQMNLKFGDDNWEYHGFAVQWIAQQADSSKIAFEEIALDDLERQAEDFGERSTPGPPPFGVRNRVWREVKAGDVYVGKLLSFSNAPHREMTQTAFRVRVDTLGSKEALREDQTDKREAKSPKE
ncbi:carboxypeptidase-like regulatory domain-containing protein [Pseudobythopirellula maris]|uniref:carboxypeptidase-like regulatory domain-containing protein n=1 Tax=Pseudobythopirellula maris TaxID=2527991 RepID=UPI0018D3E7B2|nr:carboxypeptidase-like regulatory domain-containing protein [Pseudobythopirellula maris]